MSSMSNISDPRVLAILNGGESFKRAVDPDRLLKDGFVKEIGRSTGDSGGSSGWNAVVGFPSGDSLFLWGVFESSAPKIISCRLSCIDTSSVDIPVKADFSLLGALEDLSRLPHHLQRNLSVCDLGNRQDSSFQKWDETLFSLESGSLFWSVEVSPDYLGEFRNFKVCYGYQQSVFPVSVVLSSCAFLPAGVIMVETTVDMYGLSGKKVFVDFRFGADGMIRSTCYGGVGREKRGIPSVDVAVGLLRCAVDGGKVKERRKKVSMGKPRGVPVG